MASKPINSALPSTQHLLPTGKPWNSLAHILSEETLSVVENEFGFTNLTAVQTTVIPAFMSNKDVCVHAVTGSGKTLSFVIPIVEKLTSLRTPLAPHQVGALILTPTRELAQQIHHVVSKFVSGVPFLDQDDQVTYLCSPALCIGGKNPELEMQAMRASGVNIIVGTPGRVDSIISGQNAFDFSKLELLILDEADRLLDIGFQANLNSILGKLPKQRHTGLFSATLTQKVDDLIKVGLRNPVKISLKVQYKSDNANPSPSNKADDTQTESSGEPAAATLTHQSIPSTLTNYYQIVQPEHKLLHLISFLLQHPDQNIMVFFLTCAEVDYFYRVIASFPPIAALYDSFNNEMLETVGVDQVATEHAMALTKKEKKLFPQKSMLCALHGQMNQSKRTRTYNAFYQHTDINNSINYDAKFPPAQRTDATPKRTGSVLFCTDVAARGVDVNYIDWVLQLDPPQQPDAFIHRIGRAARAGLRGHALTWILPHEESFIPFMETKNVPFKEYNSCHSLPQQQLMESTFDSIIWKPCEETYFQLPKPDTSDSNQSHQTTKKGANHAGTEIDTTQIATNVDVSSLPQLADIPALPDCIEYKAIIPYNTYKVLVDKKDNRKQFKSDTQLQKRVEQQASTRQESYARKHHELQYQIPSFTHVSLHYPSIPHLSSQDFLLSLSNFQISTQTQNSSTASEPNKEAQKLFYQQVAMFVPHARYCLGSDKHLFDIAQRSYVSHINAYKEHIAKYVFLFDRLSFVHIAIGFGLLFLPLLSDLKRFTLIWPLLTRKQPRSINVFHDEQVAISKQRQHATKLVKKDAQIAKRQQRDKEKEAEREFKERQREKKRKSKANTTYEEMAREFHELQDECRAIKKARKHGKN